jgi:hypothetical protein
MDMPKDPRIRALANKAAVKIKALTNAHESQIAAIYQQFREQAAIIQGSNADSLAGSSVTPDTQSTKN